MFAKKCEKQTQIMMSPFLNCYYKGNVSWDLGGSVLELIFYTFQLNSEGFAQCRRPCDPRPEAHTRGAEAETDRLGGG